MGCSQFFPHAVQYLGMTAAVTVHMWRVFQRYGVLLVLLIGLFLPRFVFCAEEETQDGSEKTLSGPDAENKQKSDGKRPCGEFGFVLFPIGFYSDDTDRKSVV